MLSLLQIYFKSDFNEWTIFPPPSEESFRVLLLSANTICKYLRFMLVYQPPETVSMNTQNALMIETLQVSKITLKIQQLHLSNFAYNYLHMPACVPLVNVHWLYRHSTQTKTDTLWKYIFKWLHTWKGHCTDYKALQGSHTHAQRIKN